MDPDMPDQPQTAPPSLPQPRSPSRLPRPAQELRRRVATRALVHGNPFTAYRKERGRWSFRSGDSTVRAAWFVVGIALVVVLGVAGWLNFRKPPVVERLSQVVKLEPAPVRIAAPVVSPARRAPPTVEPLTVQMGSWSAATTVPVADRTPAATLPARPLIVTTPTAGPPLRLRLDTHAPAARP